MYKLVNRYDMFFFYSFLKSGFQVRSSENVGEPNIENSKSKCPVFGCSFKSKTNMEKHYFESHDKVMIGNCLNLKHVKLYNENVQSSYANIFE